MCVPFVRPFLIHLPGALCSSGITRVRRSYGSSDSCRPSARSPAGLIASCVESSDHSVSNHPSSPRCLTWFPQPGLPSCRAQGSTHHYSRYRLTSVGLRHCQQARHDDRPNRVRHPTDWSFTFRCSPPPLAGTQFRSVTGPKSGPDRDFHPAGSIHSRSHWRRASCPWNPSAMPGRLV